MASRTFIEHSIAEHSIWKECFAPVCMAGNLTTPSDEGVSVYMTVIKQPKQALPQQNGKSVMPFWIPITDLSEEDFSADHSLHAWNKISREMFGSGS